MKLRAEPQSVRFESVGKDYGNEPVLRDVSLTVPAGAFVALIGPSGCGKSTLLRMIAGLEHIDYGEIRIGDRLINGLSPRARDVAMVFQNYALYPHMSVADNLAFSLRLARRPAGEVADRIAETARMLDIGDLLKRYPRQLSGGQRQRVAIGRALVREPSVFLFDEPLSNLDAQLRVQMRSEIKHLHRSLGITAIFVTHDQVEAMTMADIAVVMRGGRIEQVGAPLDLYDRPANAFVASFLGSPAMTLLLGRLIRTAAGLSFLDEKGGGTFALPSRFAIALDKLDDYHPCLLGMRPEHVTIDPLQEASFDGGGTNDCIGRALPGKITALEATGLDTYVATATAFGPITAILRGRSPLREGDSVLLRPDPASLCLFDAGDGRRIA